MPYFDDADIVSLCERISPLLPCPRLGAKLGLPQLWINDESQLPTGTFKSRGMAMAITPSSELAEPFPVAGETGPAGSKVMIDLATGGISNFPPGSDR